MADERYWEHWIRQQREREPRLGKLPLLVRAQRGGYRGGKLAFYALCVRDGGLDESRRASASTP